MSALLCRESGGCRVHAAAAGGRHGTRAGKPGRPAEGVAPPGGGGPGLACSRTRRPHRGAGGGEGLRDVAADPRRSFIADGRRHVEVKNARLALLLWMPDTAQGRQHRGSRRGPIPVGRPGRPTRGAAGGAASRDQRVSGSRIAGVPRTRGRGEPGCVPCRDLRPSIPHLSTVGTCLEDSLSQVPAPAFYYQGMHDVASVLLMEVGEPCAFAILTRLLVGPLRRAWHCSSLCWHTAASNHVWSTPSVLSASAAIACATIACANRPENHLSAAGT